MSPSSVQEINQPNNYAVALVQLLEVVLSPRQIRVTAQEKPDGLLITLNAPQKLNQAPAVTLIHKALEKLNPPEPMTLKLQARCYGIPDWDIAFCFQPPPIAPVITHPNPPELAIMAPEPDPASQPEPEIAPKTPVIYAWSGLPDPWFDADSATPAELPTADGELSPESDTHAAPDAPDPRAAIPEIKSEPAPTAATFTTPHVDRLPQEKEAQVAAVAGVVMGLGFCATGLGTVIGLPMIVGGLWMMGEQQVLRGPCPHCGQALKVPLGKLWRFSCPTCQGLVQIKNGRFYAQQLP